MKLIVKQMGSLKVWQVEAIASNKSVMMRSHVYLHKRSAVRAANRIKAGMRRNVKIVVEA